MTLLTAPEPVKAVPSLGSKATSVGAQICAAIPVPAGAVFPNWDEHADGLRMKLAEVTTDKDSTHSQIRDAWCALAQYDGQNMHQKAHFEHFGTLATNMVRIGLRNMILSILGPWAPAWSE